MAPGGGAGEPERVRGGTIRSFAHDLRRVARVWRRDPRLPATVVAIACLTGVWALLTETTGVGAFAIGSLVTTIYLLGFVGTNLVWTVRVDRGAAMPWGAVVRITRGLRWRYFWLYALMTVVVGAPTVVVLLVVGDGPALMPGLTVVVTVVAALLAFAFPALAFNHVRVRDAARHSLTVVRREWPRCAAYLVAPALGFLLVLGIRSLTDDGIAIAGVGLLSGVMRGLFDATTALFYADRYPTVRGGDAMDDAQLPAGRGQRPERSAVGPASSRPRSAPPTVPPPDAPPSGAPGAGIPLRRERPGVSPFRPPDDAVLRPIPASSHEVFVWKESRVDGWFAHCRICTDWFSPPEPSRKAAYTAFLRHRTEVHGAVPPKGR